MNIAKKNILITGANRGVGRALVQEALRRGAERVYAGTRAEFDFGDSRVTRITLDVTNIEQVQRAAHEISSLDLLVNNAGLALYDALDNVEAVQRQLAVNLFGPLRLTYAFLPALKRAKGAVVNNLSLASVAALPIVPGYSLSKAAAFNMTQTLRALLAADGVSVHSVVLGPVDTDMNRGFNIPKATTESAASGIFDGIEKGEQYIFPDFTSEGVAEGWRNGVVNALEQQFAVLVPPAPSNAAA